MTIAAPDISANLASVRYRIQAAAERAGRDASEITLVGISKTIDADRVREAIENGLQVLGENRVQEGAAKIEAVGETRAVWHFVGRLQTNKARKAARLFQLIQSVDSMRLAIPLDRLGEEFSRKVPVLLEVNTSREETKAGFDPRSLKEALPKLLELPHLDIQGLMTIGPVSGGREAARASFRELRLLRDTLVQTNPTVNLRTLSMGMTDDFEIAVEEGSTMVRVGRAIFGARM